MQIIANLAAGLLFGAGLAVSGLINPQKVLNFLDFAGTWDPSLALTMAAGVATAAAGYRAVFRKAKPMCGPTFHVPAAAGIDARLISGAAVFGTGWGLVGYCPGPVTAALALGETPTLIFAAAMLAGMWAARWMATAPSMASPQPSPP